MHVYIFRVSPQCVLWDVFQLHNCRRNSFHNQCILDPPILTSGIQMQYPYLPLNCPHTVNMLHTLLSCQKITVFWTICFRTSFQCEHQNNIYIHFLAWTIVNDLKIFVLYCFWSFWNVFHSELYNLTFWVEWIVNWK